MQNSLTEAELPEETSQSRRAVSCNGMSITLLRNIIFYLFIIISGLFTLIPYVIFSVYELDSAMNISFNNKYLILIFAVIFYFLFKNKLFNFKSDTKFFKPILRVCLFIFGVFIIWMFSISIITNSSLIFNSLFGKQKTINVKSIVLDTEKTKSKNGTIHNYITIEIPEIKRKVKIKVKKEYQINDIYTDTLKLGSLNMVYKYK
ncbi:hypothetical protein PG614_07845 [Riemerella anatipestifer]|nr:hypothetical protein [Riemerella anatipestifer]MDY3535858.1 hypothetical protein [Riemerella anatipestifer]